MAIKVGMVSLGCSKNQVDGEMLLALVVQNDFELSADPENCDVVIINTCGFIEDAKKESIETILEYAQLKKQGIIKAIVVTGCLAERYQNELVSEMPEADVVLGIGKNKEIVSAIRQALAGHKVAEFGEKSDLPLEGDRVLSTAPYYAYLKIAEGCDNRCSYCAIPMIRGRFRSRAIEDILEEAKGLAASGVKEINLIAQDTTRYGQDLYGEYSLDRLLTELCKIDGIRWLRVLYAYPDRITDSLLDVMAKEDKIVKYIDLPLQHANKRVLQTMNRSGDYDSLVALMQCIRNRIPGVVLRTTLIAGFPGETEEEFEQLCGFVREVQFERLGCFAYSAEEDTPAGQMENQWDEQTKLHRTDIIMEQQMDIAFQFGKSLVGQTLEVMVEGYDYEQQMYSGRSYMDAPDIDTKTLFTSEREDIQPGDFVQVEIQDAVGYDLVGIER